MVSGDVIVARREKEKVKRKKGEGTLIFADSR
jgi:hypothetical protein